MSIVSKTILKSYFETGDIPTQSQFVDLIDTLLVGYTPYFGDQLPNASAPKVYLSSSANGANDVYTVPSGRKAIVVECTRTNSTGGSIDSIPQVKSGGLYYPFGAKFSSAANAYGGAVTVSPFVFEAGETLACNCSAIGLTLWFKVIEFDNTSLLKSIRITSFVNGDNTIYTVPALTSSELVAGLTSMTSSGRVSSFNNTGGARVYSLWAVPSGGAKANTNKLINGNSIADGASSVVQAGTSYSAGDFFVLNLDTTTSSFFTFFNVIERV